MSKIEMSGIVKKVFPMEEIGAKKTPKQTVLIFRPARTDEWGDKVGFDDHFEMDVFNRKITPETLNGLLNKRVKVRAYLGTFEYDEMMNGTKTGAKRHGLRLNLVEITEVMATNTAQP